MTMLPVDVALTVAGAGVDVELSGDHLVAALRRAIADRRGSLGDVVLGDVGWSVQLLSPARVTFHARTEELAYAWALIDLMGETGEIGVTDFAG
jgi:hypothetical protein